MAQIVRAPVILQKKTQTLVESTRSPGLLSGFFANKPSNFTKINPQSRPFKWVGLPPAGTVYRRTWALLGRIRPDDVFLFSCEFIIYLKRLKFCKEHNVDLDFSKVFYK